MDHMQYGITPIDFTTGESTAEPTGFTSVWRHWRYFGEPQALPKAERLLEALCDLRLPLTLSESDCSAIVAVIAESLHAAHSLAAPHAEVVVS